MTASRSGPRIAVIGCGAIARSFHLPALSRHSGSIPQLVLVDRDPERATALAAEFGVAATATSYGDLLREIDGAIVTVPHHLHYRVALECLRAGVHVLCEKPLAASPDEAREMIAAADSAGVTLAVNHVRRLHPAARRIREMIAGGELGDMRRVEFLMGEKFDWPATTGFYFGLDGAPHGVLLDKGPHALDLICWWLGCVPQVVSFRDDSFGGGEAMGSATLRAGPCTINAEFSFLNRYANTFALTGTRGRIDGSLAEPARFDFTPAGGRTQTIRLRSAATSSEEFGNEMIDNFLAVVAGTAQPLVTGADVLGSVVLIDECYRQRQRYEMPWHDAWRRIANA